MSKGYMRAYGTIVLPTITAAALWMHEVSSQLSEGIWKNTNPRDHWKFWIMLGCEYMYGARPAVESSDSCAVKNYDLNKLISNPAYRDRMIVKAKMAIALMNADQNPLKYESAVRDSMYMPKSHVEWWSNKAVDVSGEIAEAFYAAKYDVNDLKADLRLIKTAMLSATQQAA